MMNIKNIIEKYKAPFYLYDVSLLKERTDLMRKYLPDIGLCFAMKAAPVLAGFISDMVDRLEVCSPGEFEICIRQGVKPEKLLISGVNKTYESIMRTLTLGEGKCIYTIESEDQFRLLDRAAGDTGHILKCYIRLSSGNQFGVDKVTLEKLIENVNSSDNLNLAGIHFFSGTQKTLKRISSELSELKTYGSELREKYNRDFCLEFGPGIGTDYFGSVENDGRTAEILHAEEQLDGLAKIVEETGIGDIFKNITFEYGRFIAAPAAKYYTGVADIKSTFGTNYAILEGGIHQLTYYGSMAGMKVPYIDVIKMSANDDTLSGDGKKSSDSGSTDADKLTQDSGSMNTDKLTQNPDSPDESAEYVLAGSLCSVNDILVRKAVLPELKKGDVLSFDLAGAYALTEGIALFLSRDLPAILIRDNDDIRIIRDHIETNPINDGSAVITEKSL